MKVQFYILYIFIFSVFISSCKTDPTLYEINNLNGNKIFCFGHGGMGIEFKYPIDTYESIVPCLQIGPDGSEMDIQMTKDSVLIAYHNSNLNQSTLCNGTINDKLWSEMWGCHFASPFSSTVNLMSVNDLLNKLNTIHNYTFTFDCKLYSNNANQVAYKNQYANAIIRLIDSQNLNSEKLYIESLDTTFLKTLQTKRSNLKLFIYPSSFENGLAIAQSLNLFGITISNYNISEEQIKLAHQKGIQIALWNVNSKNDHIEAINKNPDFIQSDDIIYLLKIFGKYKK